MASLPTRHVWRKHLWRCHLQSILLQVWSPQANRKRLLYYQLFLHWHGSFNYGRHEQSEKRPKLVTRRRGKRGRRFSMDTLERNR